MPASKRSSNGSFPYRFESAIHADTAPGTVTESHPRLGMIFLPAKRSGVQSAGERPDALRPTRRWPSQRIAKTSEPMPLDVGSTTVSVMAAARPASTALPPFASMASPACAASGCDVATMFFASTGMRCEAYGKFQLYMRSFAEGLGSEGGIANGSIGKKADYDQGRISAGIRRVRDHLRRALGHGARRV